MLIRQETRMHCAFDEPVELGITLLALWPKLIYEPCRFIKLYEQFSSGFAGTEIIDEHGTFTTSIYGSMRGLEIRATCNPTISADEVIQKYSLFCERLKQVQDCIDRHKHDLAFIVRFILLNVRGRSIVVLEQLWELIGDYFESEEVSLEEIAENEPTLDDLVWIGPPVDSTEEYQSLTL
jgi:hypothetical protein